jgi:hypothetical protein
LTLESLHYHEVDCQFRVIFCPVLTCNACSDVPKIIFKNLEDHLTEHHTDTPTDTSYTERTFTVTEEDLASTANICWGPQLTKLVLNNAQFFRGMAKEKDHFYIWIYYYGSKEEAENYQCTIKVYGGAGEEYNYIGPPRSLDESKDQIIREGNTLLLCVSQVKRLLVDKNCLQCSVKVSCPKDEAKDEDVESGISDNENKNSNHST